MTTTETAQSGTSQILETGEKRDLLRRIRYYSKKIERWKQEIHKVFIGQEEVLDAVMIAIISNGHVLLEGAPGLAKSLLVMTLGRTVRDAKYQRIQFTPDLLPTDLTGIQAYNPDKGFYTVKGPVFANFILADEINRAPPKVQSAMLSVMQEKQVVIGRKVYELPRPFFVLATQNPIEQMGTYPLPEAQVDRFLFKVFVTYPDKETERIVLENNTTTREFSSYDLKQVMSPEDIFAMQDTVKEIYVAPEIKEYIVDIVDATRNPENYGLKYSKYIDWGGSPRASIALYISSKAAAFVEGRDYVLPEDVKRVAHNVLRHRIILNYEGKAIGLSTDQIIDDILERVPVK